MFPDDYEAQATTTEDKRVSLMRKFVDLTDALDMEHKSAAERQAKIAALSADREALRNELLSIISPNQKAMPQEFLDEMKRAY